MENNKINTFIIILFFYFIIFNYENKNPTNIPELLNYKNQTLNIFTSSKNCPSTLYFLPEFKKNNNSYKIKRINLQDKNYFVTFFCNHRFYVYNNLLLVKNGLIKSEYKYGDNNLYITAFDKYPTFLNKTNSHGIIKYQKVFRYLSANILFQKNILYKCYSSMKKLYMNDFEFMPETYYYPEQKNIIINKFKNYNLTFNDLWLVKPTNLGEGHGINILESFDSIKLKEFVITKYITNIHLINGKKYDLRIYVLISGLKPLRIYLYKEGQAKMASENFSLNETNIKNNFIHLTNVRVNEHNKKNVLPNKPNDYAANVWNILMYKKFLNNKGIEWEDIKEKIKDIIIKSIISVYNNLTKEIEEQDFNDQTFYEILGYDIIITNDFIPKLIEINFTPDMRAINDNTKSLKINLFIDTLNLVGITPFNRKTQKPLYNEFKSQSIFDEIINNALCELERPKGDFELIFPTKNNINIYKKYFINNNKENKKFWDKINSFS